MKYAKVAKLTIVRVNGIPYVSPTGVFDSKDKIEYEEVDAWYCPNCNYMLASQGDPHNNCSIYCIKCGQPCLLPR